MSQSSVPCRSRHKPNGEFHPSGFSCARRRRGRIETVLDFAAAQQLRSGDNPASWKILGHSLPAPRMVKRVEHQAALPWRRMPAFMAELRLRRAPAARALELVILTATRTNEALCCRWPEFDLDAAIWTIRSVRMKGGRVHRVALSPAAVAMLRDLKEQAADPKGCVFPGQRPDRPLSQMSMAMLLRRMQRDDDAEGDEPAPALWVDAEGREITVHGFRSTFRDWAGDVSGFDRDVVEAALAHTLKSKAEAAYARSDLLERRRPLMAAWASFVGGGEVGGQVVELAARRSA